MSETWIKTKVLTAEYNDAFEENEKLISMGITPKHDVSEYKKKWSKTMVLLEDIVDVIECDIEERKGISRVRMHDGREMYLSCPFNNLFLALIGRPDAIDDFDEFEIYYEEINEKNEQLN
jgi:hypothetical protein